MKILLWLFGWMPSQQKPKLENVMTDTTQQNTSADAGAAAAAPAAAAPSVDPTKSLTDRLKAMLLALGHDVEDVWDEVVSVAKKRL